jgi:heat shock protein HtpX
MINALRKLESGVKGHQNSNPSMASTESLFIVNPFKSSSLFKMFSTHPSTESRIAALKRLKIQR